MGCNSLSQNECNVNLKFFKKNKTKQMKKTSLLILGLILRLFYINVILSHLSFEK